MKKIRRNIVFILLAICILANGCTEKPQELKVYRIGILCGLDYIADIVDGFKKTMAELGYIEGKNIVYDVRRTNFEPEKEKQILQEFVNRHVDLIFTFPTEVSMFAKAAAKDSGIPVLFTFANIEDTNLVDSIRRPGGNITGVRYPGPDLAIKRFEIMREIAPNAKRIWIPYQRGYPIVLSQIKALKPLAEAEGVTLIEFPADNAAELDAELQRRAVLADIGIDAILFVAEPLTVTPDAFAVMGKFAAEHKIPIGGALISVNGYESLFGVNVKLESAARQSAILANKILKGTPAGSIPVVSAESFIQINYRAAKAMGLNVPEGLLNIADEVIK